MIQPSVSLSFLRRTQFQCLLPPHHMRKPLVVISNFHSRTFVQEVFRIRHMFLLWWNCRLKPLLSCLVVKKKYFNDLHDPSMMSELCLPLLKTTRRNFMVYGYDMVRASGQISQLPRLERISNKDGCIMTPAARRMLEVANGTIILFNTAEQPSFATILAYYIWFESQHTGRRLRSISGHIEAPTCLPCPSPDAYCRYSYHHSTTRNGCLSRTATGPKRCSLSDVITEPQRRKRTALKKEACSIS